MTDQNKPNEETAKQEQPKQEQVEQEQKKAVEGEQAQAEKEISEAKQAQAEKEATEGGEENIENVKTISALAYLIFFLPLLTNPESKFGKFHANQALLLLITWLAIMLVSTIIPPLGIIIIPLGIIFCLVLFVKGIINAVNGKTERLPLIGGYDIIK